MGNDAAHVYGEGTIYLNQDALLTPEQWAFTIAHCKLHLAFGHFDAERMPGYDKAGPDGSSEWVATQTQLGSPWLQSPAGNAPGTDQQNKAAAS